MLFLVFNIMKKLIYLFYSISNYSINKNINKMSIILNPLFSLNNYLEYSNKNICSFEILEDTKCMKRISNTVFEYTNDFVKNGETYDMQIIQINNNYYLSMGYDFSLEYDVYIPINSNKTNVKLIE